MSYILKDMETLHRLCLDIFKKEGFSEEDAAFIADVLLTSDLSGIDSHGIQRLYRYYKCIGSGMIRPGACPEIIFETPVSAVIDGNDAMLGTNPIAVAFPADPVDFLFDAGTSVVTRGKLEIYNKEGKPLHDGWALDGAGHPTEDAAEVLFNIAHHGGGGILPLGGASEETGGHKGYGFAMICELFSSILSLGTPSSSTGRDGRGLICHGFAAIDPSIFGDAGAIRKHLSAYLESIRTSPKAEGADRIFTHGEKEADAEARARREGIPVLDSTLIEIKEVCDGLELDYSSYFGDEAVPDTGFKGNFY